MLANFGRNKIFGSPKRVARWFLVTIPVIIIALVLLTPVALARILSLPDNLMQGLPYIDIDYDYDGGTVEGVTWEGTSNIYWDVESGHVVYGGASITETSQQVLWIYVATYGREYCGGNIFLLDTDWSLSDAKSPGTMVGQYSDAGWATLGECSWWPGYGITTVINDGNHTVWLYGQGEGRGVTNPACALEY